MLTIESGKANNKRPKLRQLKCVICAIDFQKYIAPSEIALGHGKVCSKECKNKLNGIQKFKSVERVCKTCGKTFLHKPSEDRRGSKHEVCSMNCRYPNKKLGLPNGQYYSYDGYIVLSTTPDKRKQIKMHRHIMELHIGRRLLSKEIVHHINENKLDNRIENLQIVSRSEHNRIHDHFAERNRLRKEAASTSRV